MGRTALVHPETAKLTPDEQKRGTYLFTPPEVLAYQQGADLNDADLAIVHKFYADTLPPQQVMQYAQAQGEAALAEVNTVSRTGTVHGVTRHSIGGGIQNLPRKLVKKKAPAPELDVVGAVRTLVASLSDEQAWPILVDIAKRHHLEIE